MLESSTFIRWDLLLHWQCGVLEVVTRPLLLLVRNEAANVSGAVTKKLRALSEFEVEHFLPPLPAGQEPVGMPAEVHFADGE